MALSATLICLGLVVLFFFFLYSTTNLGDVIPETWTLTCIDTVCFVGPRETITCCLPNLAGVMTELRTGCIGMNILLNSVRRGKFGLASKTTGNKEDCNN